MGSPYGAGVQVDEQVNTAANAAVAALLRKQLAAGEHHGVAVAAFLHGAPLVHAWAGPGVNGSSLIMGASVAKGATAAALAVLHAKGMLDYSVRVSSLWPGFENGKENVTVEQAISHRAGLCTSLPGPRALVQFLHCFYTRGWRAMGDAGVAWIATLRPQWPPGTYAQYHPISFSWIVCGIVHGCTGGQHLRDLFVEHVAAPLQSASAMYLGVLPPHESRRVVRLVRQTIAQMWRNTGAASFMVVRVLRLVVAWLEAVIMTAIFNAVVFREVCLPSSNGFWTAMSLARLYGAFANGGSVQLPDTSRSVQLLDASKLEALLCKIRTDARVDSHRGDASAMNALGWSPWPSLGAPTDSLVLGHGGMGGSVAWAAVDLGLSVAVLRTGYSPISLGDCAATRELCECILAHAARDA